MKCLKNEMGIIRVTDDESVKMVRGGKWSYCSKSEWKQKVRDVKKEKPVKKEEGEQKPKKIKKPKRGRRKDK